MKQFYKCFGIPFLTFLLVGHQCPGWFSVLKTMLCSLLEVSLKKVSVIISWTVLKLWIWVGSKAFSKPLTGVSFSRLEAHVVTLASYCYSNWGGQLQAVQTIISCRWKEKRGAYIHMAPALLPAWVPEPALSLALPARFVSSVLSSPWFSD